MKNTKLTRNILLTVVILLMVGDIIVPFKSNPGLDLTFSIAWLAGWIIWMRLINKKTELLRTYKEAITMEKHINRYTEYMLRCNIIKDDITARSAAQAYVRTMLKREEYKDIHKAMD